MAELEVFPDYSELPDVAWVTIMRCLRISSRFNLAMTCKRLYDIFQHPSLWYYQDLHFWGDSDFFSSGAAKKVQPVIRYAPLIERFGKYMQDLTVKVSGHFKDIPDDIKAALSEVGKECRLQKLTIDAGKLTSYIHYQWGELPETSALDAIATFVKNAYRMKELDIRSWPMHRNVQESSCNIFMSIIENEKLGKRLESLTMFRVESKEWSEREPILPHPQVVNKVLVACPNLSTVTLRSPMIDQFVMTTFADPEREKLRILRVIVHYIDTPEFQVPTVSSQSWQALINSYPGFRVELSILLKTPHLELANILTPEVPLSSIVYLKYSKIDPMTITALATHYKRTLVRFHSFGDSSNIDQELLHMTRECTELTDFIYHGQISVTTAVNIAKTRGKYWSTFELEADNIVVPDEYEDVDENQVISERDGQLVLVSLMRFHQPATYRQILLAEMITEISNVLETQWKPLNYQI